MLPPSSTEANTLFLNKRCYARALSNCSKEISNEHYISESILRIKNPEGLIDIIAAPWRNQNKTLTIPVRNFGKKILCKRHNENLSSLDSLAHRFFNFLIENSSEKDSLKINGYDLERWFLKLLCGAQVSAKVDSWIPPQKWLDILFNNGPFPEKCGLHFVTGNYRARIRQHEVHIIKSSETNLPVAAVFVMRGFIFLITMEELPPPNSQVYSKTHYRPKAIEVSDDGNTEHIIYLGWEDGEIVRIGRGKPHNNPPNVANV